MKFSILSLASVGTTALVLSQTSLAQGEQLRKSDRSEYPRIESRRLDSGFVSISVTNPPVSEDSNERQLAQLTRHLEELRSCRIYIEEVHFLQEANRRHRAKSQEKMVCTIEDYVGEEDETPYPFALEIAGDISELRQMFEDAGTISGVSMLRWDPLDAVTIDEMDNKLTLNRPFGDGLWVDVEGVNEGAEIENGRDLQLFPGRSTIRTTGVLRTIVVRIVGGDVEPAPSLGEIHAEIYGSQGSLKSQMELCSHGKLVIEPFEGTARGAWTEAIEAGAIELRLQTSPIGKTDKAMENVANQAASYVLGNLSDQFDLVIFSMPKGMTPPYAAYAYVGSPYSYYNDDKVVDLMVQMHEVGHNLGLQHAGEEGDRLDEYGDPSGYMGYSPVKDPNMCFNAANSYQLGWYNTISTAPLDVGAITGAFALSDVNSYNPNDTTKYVSLRLEQPTLQVDFYVGYNRAIGINSGTQEDPDKVIVFQKAGSPFSPNISWKKAALGPGEECIIQNFDQSGKFVKIAFLREDADGTAIVEIMPERDPTPEPTPPPSSLQSEAPSMSPSISPSIYPSNVATSSGTSSGTTSFTLLRDSCKHGESKLEVKLKLDSYPWENHYKLKKGTEVKTIERFDGKEPRSELTYDDCLLPDTCYEFKWFDNGRDGLSDPDAFYAVYLDSTLLFKVKGLEGLEDADNRSRSTSHEICTGT